MNQLPIIQTFFNKPVRFFKASFEVEMHRHHDGASGQKSTEMRHHNDAPSTQIFILQTWAVPLPDYADAIGYPHRVIRRMIRLNNRV